MRKHHSGHWVVRALAGLTGCATALVGLGFFEVLPAQADGAAPDQLVPSQGPAPPRGAAPSADTSETHAEHFAVAQVGKPYSYGAAGPGAYDCSGLVYRSYAMVGVSLPRTAAEQYASGAHVPLSDLQPGDLVFWARDDSDPASIYHVGIYVGYGAVVNATHTGSTVQVMPASELGTAFPEATRP